MDLCEILRRPDALFRIFIGLVACALVSFIASFSILCLAPNSPIAMAPITLCIISGLLAWKISDMVNRLEDPAGYLSRSDHSGVGGMRKALTELQTQLRYDDPRAGQSALNLASILEEELCSGQTAVRPPCDYAESETLLIRGEAANLDDLLGTPLTKSLPPPFDLVAGWLAYVPLETLVRVHFFAMAAFHENEDSTVTMKWQAPYGIEPIIPGDLLDKTLAYEESMIISKEYAKIEPWNKIRTFVVDGRNITERDFLCAVEDTLRRKKIAP
jgi:hypothetical protein